MATSSGGHGRPPIEDRNHKLENLLFCGSQNFKLTVENLADLLLLIYEELSNSIHKRDKFISLFIRKGLKLFYKCYISSLTLDKLV